MTCVFQVLAFRVPPKGGRVLSIWDPTTSLDVWVLPRKIMVMRWPRGGMVRAWTIAGDKVAKTNQSDAGRLKLSVGTTFNALHENPQ